MPPLVDTLLTRAAAFDWDAYAAGLEAIEAKYYGRLQVAAYRDASANLGRAIPFDRAGADALTRQIGTRVATMTATQRDRVATHIAAYTGEDRAALVQAVADALGDNAGFAARIARSEVSHVYNSATAQATAAAGLAGCDVADGDADPDCAAVNGTYQTVAWCLAHPTEHPFCTRSFTPAERTAA